MTRYEGVTVNGNFNTGTVHGGMTTSLSAGQPSAPTHGRAETLDVFVSHSHADAELVYALVELLMVSIPGVQRSRIRASSRASMSLQTGARLEESLLREAKDAGVVLGVLTPASISSTYVIAEMTVGLEAGSLVTAFAGVDAPAPGLFHHTVQRDLTGAEDVRKLMTDIAERLRLDIGDPAESTDAVKAVTTLASRMTPRSLP